MHLIRKHRNGIIHNNEQYCETSNKYCIKYKLNPKKSDEEDILLYEAEFKEHRNKLNSAHEEIENIYNNMNEN